MDILMRFGSLSDFSRKFWHANSVRSGSTRESARSHRIHSIAFRFQLTFTARLCRIRMRTDSNSCLPVEKQKGTMMSCIRTTELRRQQGVQFWTSLSL